MTAPGVTVAGCVYRCRRVLRTGGRTDASVASPGCRNGGGDTGTRIGTDPPATSNPPSTTAASSAVDAVPGKALVVVEENHTQSAVLNGMPYLASLADTYGQTTAYQAVAHPSLPNYLAIIGGSTFGVTDDQPPPDHPVPGASVLDLAIAKTATAKAYIEDMPGPCTLDSNGDYAVKHNPWAYFADPVSYTHL